MSSTVSNESAPKSFVKLALSVTSPSSTPNLSIMNEIYKTFILSNPSNKACVSWSRIDNEQAGGLITKRNKKIIISKM